MTNIICQGCPDAHNAVNGRYCRKLKRYVQNAQFPMCQTQNNQQQ